MVNPCESLFLHTGTLCINVLSFGETCEGTFRSFVGFILGQMRLRDKSDKPTLAGALAYDPVCELMHTYETTYDTM